MNSFIDHISTWCKVFIANQVVFRTTVQMITSAMISWYLKIHILITGVVRNCIQESKHPETKDAETVLNNIKRKNQFFCKMMLTSDIGKIEGVGVHVCTYVLKFKFLA